MNRLINRNTGQIVVYGEGIVDLKSLGCKNVAEFLEAGWEDYEEPETYYYISDCGNIESLTNDHGNNLPKEIWDKAIKRRKQICNYFETKEEAEKAVKKLLAWKRLKDRGFRFEGWEMDGGAIWFGTKQDEQEWSPKYRNDLDLLFGGEDE